jgi:hypothetical protein
VGTPGAELLIEARFNGPPASANGGYACGLIARHAASALGSQVAVTLHAPPPLDTRLRLVTGGRRAHAFAGDELIAGAAADLTDMAAPGPVSWSLAAEAEAAFTGDRGHPFPTCFVCGTSRPAGDGMALRPGRVTGRSDTVACRWWPDQTLAVAGVIPPELVWAALDCPGGWTGEPAREPMVLGRMVARIDAPPRPGRPHVLVGQQLARNGRTATNLTALFDEHGAPLARAAAIWVAIT